MSKLCSTKLLIILSHARKSTMDRFHQTSGRRLASCNCQIPWQGTEFPPDFNKLHTLLITAHTFTERPKTGQQWTSDKENHEYLFTKQTDNEVKRKSSFNVSIPVSQCPFSLYFILSYIELDRKCDNGSLNKEKGQI